MEFKSAKRLPRGESFDCAKCSGTPIEEKRNCRGAYDTKYLTRIGAMEFYQCPLSIFGFDGEVTRIIDLILTSLESGIPVAFGVLTVDTIDQAIERSGTKAGNKGGEAAQSALEMVAVLKRLEAE